VNDPRQRLSTPEPPLTKIPEPDTSAAARSRTMTALLEQFLARQVGSVARHRLPDGRAVWAKRAGPRHGLWRYRVLGALARLLRADVLRPVPNTGGSAAIATEARRLRDLAARGLRVPAVLAESERGLLLEDLSPAEAPGRSLGDELGDAWPHGPDALLPLWRDGLDAIARVHARGTCLSQAFARNLVRLPDGGIGFIDFEDDPLATLCLPDAQARDWLSYLHATALAVHEAGASAAAARALYDTLRQEPLAVRDALDASARRMHWLGRLPDTRRWGRDLQRTGAAARLLTCALEAPAGRGR
jgi:hypothetical protein